MELLFQFKSKNQMSNAVVIKSGIARRIDPRTGSDRGSVGASNAIDAASDGTLIVIRYKDYRARRYDASSGSDKGFVGSSRVIAYKISCGVIVLKYKDGKARRYDAKTGSDKGGV